ncbi:MAG: fimbrillin family protein [Prevotella sp.]|nr:fimbrillin family protein [Prevotella sp.]
MKKVRFMQMAMLMAAMTFTACQNSDVDEMSGSKPGQEEIVLDMIYPHSGGTRATETAFEKSDQIGVYVTTTGAPLQLGGNEVNNALFSYDGSVWTASKKVYWNEGKHNVYAYYPYSEDVNDVDDYSFSVQEDQSTAKGYTLSDFLWASATGVTASATAVKMQFAHKMSCVVVKLEKGENFEGNIPDNAEVYIYSTVTKAAINLSTGDVAKDNYAGTSTIRCLKKSAGEYTACVVPQNITSRRPLVEVIVDGVSYLMEGKISLKPGMRHTITVSLDKNPEKIKIDIGGEIGNW